MSEFVNGIVKVDFRKEGNLAQVTTTGFWDAELPGSWSIGTLSTLTMAAPLLKNDTVRLSLIASPYLKPGVLEAQRLTIILNRRVIHDSIHGELATIELPLPAALLAGSPLVGLVFRHPDALAPSPSGPGDTRQLGFMFHLLSLGDL